MRKCACAHSRVFRHMSPTSQLFEVDVAGVAPPRRVSKLSRRNTRHLNMPPKLARGMAAGRVSVAVAPIHPSKVAAAKKNAAAGSGDAIVSTSVSPPRGTKSMASTKITITKQMSPSVHVPVASVTPEMAETMPSVSVAVVGNPGEHLLKRAKSGVNSGGDSSPARSVLPALPPLWNAWYLACKCRMCGDAHPTLHDTMLDPDQIA